MAMNKPRLMLLAGAVVLVVAGAATMVLRNAGPGMALDSATLGHVTPAVRDTAVATPAAKSHRLPIGDVDRWRGDDAG